MVATYYSMVRIYEPLGRRIAQARRSVRLSQPELADLAGVSKSLIGHMESGAKRTSPDNLRRIAVALGLDYEELAGLAGYPVRPVPEGIVIEGDDPKVHTLRRLSRLPSDVLNEVEHFIARVYRLPVPPAEDEPEHKAD